MRMSYFPILLGLSTWLQMHLIIILSKVRSWRGIRVHPGLDQIIWAVWGSRIRRWIIWNLWRRSRRIGRGRRMLQMPSWYLAEGRQWRSQRCSSRVWCRIIPCWLARSSLSGPGVIAKRLDSPQGTRICKQVGLNWVQSRWMESWIQQQF